MRISKRADYALRVLFTLVAENGRRPVSIRELAERNGRAQAVLGAHHAEPEGAGLGGQLAG